jgi:eukaryotic-like serine/threonine-protein kinase
MTKQSDTGSGRERLDRMEQLYEEVRSLSPAEQQSFIGRACGGDEALRAELTVLLQHAERAESFFGRLGETVPSIPLAPVLVAGRYEIHERLGAGGMGVVYRARDRQLQRDVALKFLPPQVDREPDAARALLREARAAAALEHPNICSVHEVGSSEDGRPFICMTLCEGETLRDRLARGPIPIPETIDIVRQLTSGLAAAHERGIVHRDIKPGNIMLLRDRVVKLLDFGLARLSDATVTGPGPVTGTVAYMSPEQLDGDAVGPASDLFSLGVVLYEMIAGVRPFRGDSPIVMMQAIRTHDPEPMRKRHPAVPAALEHVVGRLLEKRPHARYPTARAVLDDLEPLLRSSDGPPLQLRQSGWSRRSRFAAAGILLAAVAGMSALVFQYAKASDAAPGPLSGAATGAAAAAGKTVAVLPFGNVGHDPADDYLVDGLTEELIGALSQVQSLRVVARTSAFAFKDAKRDIREIGKALAVNAILEGSVQRSGDRIRVRAQLINVEDGLHLWSEAYDREVDDIFAVQRDLALRIAASMQAGLSAVERERVGERRTVNPDAYNLYLKGKHFWNQRTSPAYSTARDYYERAIRIDPAFASAYAGLAAVYSLQGLSGDLPSAVARERMRVAATRAVELDDELAEAHAVLGVYFHVYEWNSVAAEREQLRAIELDPRHVTARFFHGNMLRSHGRVDEAIAQYRIAAQVDPLDPLIGEALGRTLILAGKLDEARQHFLGALELDSLFWRSHAGLGSYYEAKGQLGESLREYRRSRELGGPIEPVARLLARTGEKREAGDILGGLQRHAEETGIHTPEVASILLSMHGADSAIAWLEKAYRERHPRLRFLPGQPEYRLLEDDPRYIDLLRRIGLRD